MINIEEYLLQQFEIHIKNFFLEDALIFFNNTRIEFLPYAEVWNIRQKSIAIPNDIKAITNPIDVYKVPFNGTQITLWNRFPQPNSHEWVPLPNSESPIWYQHKSGTTVPAWNIFDNIIGLLTFREEIENGNRDTLGRFIASFSPRKRYDLLEIPVFNEAVAIIIGACYGLHKVGYPITEIAHLLQPPKLVLSHDVDIILGNDFWTQLARLYHVFSPLAKGKWPNLKNFWWITKNIINPKAFYYDNIIEMIKLERSYGYTSTWYFLNGTFGRFGARSRLEVVAEAIELIPPEWTIGIHYNFDTYLNEIIFKKQIEELTKIIKYIPKYGRSHYLRFENNQSLKHYANMGIICDETAGYPDSIGYRCGIAGPFQPYDITNEEIIPIWELPLIIMDSTLIDQYPQREIWAFSRLLNHLIKIGGAITILFHPGVFNNPEIPKATGIYEKLLDVAKMNKVIGISCKDIIPYNY